MRRIARDISVLLAAIAVGGVIGVESLQAQVVANPGDTNTIVTPVGNRFDIGGGQLSGDNANLFHSLSQFGLTQAQIANFLSNPSTRNILVRVTGGDASRLDGLIQVSGSNANLFLMNPSGIIFGSSATLNVPGSFTATTANGIGFGSNWFNASGTNNYETLVGNPSSYAFTVTQPGAIVNAGYLTVGVGQQLTLLGGTVVSSGGLDAPQGQIIVAAVPGQSIVRLSQPGSVLSLEVQRPTPNDRVEAWTLPILSLPQLLTGGSGSNATGLTVDANGQVTLTGSGVAIASGDVAVQQATAGLNGVFQYARSTLFDAAAFFPTTKPALRLVAPPPEQVLPLKPNLVAPPNQVLPGASIRQSTPPDATLPSTTVPDCGVACSNQTMPSPQSTQPSQTIGGTSSTSPMVNFQQPSNQPNAVVTLTEPLPQYSTQATVSQPNVVQTSSVQPTSSNTVQRNFVQPSSLDLLTGNLEQTRSTGEIDDLNETSAIALRLKALKKYLQTRWKATPQLTAKLRYTLRLDARGAIQQIIPVGQEAAAYLADLKLTSADTATARQAAQWLDVIVTLSPDGTVEVMPNSLTLRN
ncbi:MAG: filamentous hemagglutinin N-terminal domain-containing protein [Stenomitos rutilans HA7619-LM2]|jgi:filamentous hemagglutinin family protein|nr:filamentous hemagglutinin N-terminal domain-containing protein [Stenomitos rutilans HA7619-LM2]